MGRTNSTWRELLLGRATKDRRTTGGRSRFARDGRSLRMEPLEKRELLSVTPAGYWELDETTGTTAFDASGNGLNGTLVAGPQWTADGKLGGAIDKVCRALGISPGVRECTKICSVLFAANPLG